MHFQSFDYLFAFLPLAWLAYLVLRHTPLRQVVLIVSGYLFYAWGTPWIAILLFASTTIDFGIGLLMEQTHTSWHRKVLLGLSLAFNLGLLSAFKYSPWMFGGINDLLVHLHHKAQLPILDIPLPPGISFYTFQSLAYIIDIYRGKIHAHRRPLDYYAFVAFFPQLFAGPIERAGQLLPQIVHPPRLRFRLFEMGVFMIMWGLFKKLVVADNMGGLVELSRANMSLHGSGILLILAFTCQIYADFSGYTDIARGSAKLFGVKLRRNFLTPYFARNPSDFWQRWHISLSSWIRDYVFISLGGNRGGKMRTLFNLLITMFLAGLWHGAGSMFLLWGVYHGILLVVYRVVPIDQHLERRYGKLGKMIAVLLMFALTSMGWGLFYSGTHGSLHQIFSSPSPGLATVTVGALYYGLFLFSSPMVLTEVLAYRKRREFVDLWLHMARLSKVALLICLFYGIIFFGARDSHEFIYFHF